MGWGRFLRRSRWDDERASELQSYVEIETDANVARGMSPGEARDAALRKLGDRTHIREEIFEMNTLGLVESVWKDLRYGFRLLRRSPTFSVVAILTLTLGTGANAAIFQLVNALRLRPLPVEKPHELVSIGLDTHDKGRVGWGMNRRPVLSEPLWRAVAAQQRAFSSVFAYGLTAWNLGTDGTYRRAHGMYVTGGFFAGLGVRPAAGRLLTAADDEKGCGNPGAVLAHGFWQSRYAGSPGVIGQEITLDGRSFEIVGVTAPGFFGVEVGHTFDVALPLCAEPMMRGETTGFDRGDRWFLDPMGRLAPGWTVERADAHLRSISPGIFGTTVPPSYNPATAKDYAAFLFSAVPGGTGVSGLRRLYTTPLWVLLGSTGLVLLVACVNLANLMLARATAREREIGVRLAIGASRWRVVRQMMAESLLIAVFGALGGVALARWLGQAVVAFLSTEGNRIFLDLAPDWRMFGFVVLVAVVACVIFGAAPAAAATSAGPSRSVQAGNGRTHTDPRERLVLRRGLVVTQVALSMVLVVGALLFGRSLQRLASVDLGFDPAGVVAVSVDLRQAGIEPAARAQAFEGILAAVRAVPGVRGASRTMVVPIAAGSEWNGRVLVDGILSPSLAYFNEVDGEYFRMMGIPLLAGRIFDSRDRTGTQKVAVVTEAFARRHFPRGPAVGRTFQMEGPQEAAAPRFEVIGIVRDVKYLDLREDWKPVAFVAASQGEPFRPGVDFLLRAGVPPASLTPSLTRAITGVAPSAVVSYEAVERIIRDSLVTDRLVAALAGVFGVLALLIASIGLYGLISYSVTRRRAEIGIRMVLGAAPRGVVRMVLGESGVLLGLGLAVGAVLAGLATHWASGLLFGLAPWDPVSFSLAAATLAGVSLAAAWIPARRVSRLDPAIALRE